MSNQITISDTERRASHIISGVTLMALTAAAGFLWTSNERLAEIAVTQAYIQKSQTQTQVSISGHIAKYAEFQSDVVDRFGKVEQEVIKLGSRVSRNEEKINEQE